MATKFDIITGNDEIFKNKEYVEDSIIFNSIESARKENGYELYSDHKSVIILITKNDHRVWLWTSASIKDDTNKLIDICRFLRDCNIPKAEIYLKQDVADSFSDLYALTTLEINYSITDEFSIAVFTHTGEKIAEIPAAAPDQDEKIIQIDKNDPEQVRMVQEFYESLKEEFHWQNKLERKVRQYLDCEMYALVKGQRIVANAVIGSRTEEFLRIKSIAVLAGERRKGYGYKICVHTLNKIKEKGLTPILYTHIGNAAAMALWAKTAFKEKNKLYLLKIENND